MNKPSLIAAAVAAVLTTFSHGSAAAPWTQTSLDKVIGEQASGEEPVLQDVALNLDQGQIRSGASAAAVMVDGTRSASAIRNSLTLALSEDCSLAELAAAEVFARSEVQTVQTSAQASDNILSVQAKNVTASGRWTGASVESSSNALAQGNGLNVTVETLDVLSWGESTGFYGSVVDGSTGTASGSWVTMSVGTAEAREMQVAGAQVTGVSAEALNNKVTVGFDEYEVEELRLYGGRATAQPTSDTEQKATQAIASNNEVTGVFGTVGADSEIQVYGGGARAYGQDAVSVADGNSTRIEIVEIAGSSSQNPFLSIHAGESNAENEYGDPMPQSSQASASSNVLTGYFGSVSGSDFDLTAGSAKADGLDAVSVADSNRLTFEVTTLSSNPYFTVTGGNSAAGSTSSASQVQSAQASASGNEVSGLLGSVNGRVSGMTGQYIRMVAGNAEAYGQDAVSVADSNRFTIEISSLASAPTTTVIGGTALAGYTDDDFLSLSAQASASGNVVTGNFGSISDSDLAMAAGNARAYGQDAVSFAEGNHLTFETATSVSNSTLEFYGGFSAAESASGDLQSAQASASGNKVSGRFESVSNSTISMFAGSAAANGQNVVSLADGNQLDLEISSLSSSDDSGDDSSDGFSVIGGNSVADSLSVALPSVSAQASASGNEVSGRFESVSDSFISMIAGSAAAYGQKAVSSADGNRLTFEIATSVSNSTLDIQGGLAMAGGASGDSQSAQASASGNLVTGSISGSVGQSSSLGIYGGRATAVAQDSTAVADNNQVQLTLEETDGSMQLLLLGASARALTTAVADGNLLRVSGGADTAIKGTLYGAQVEIERSDSDSAQANASGNRVEVSGIDLTGSITGALVENRNSSGSVNAEGNVVVISSSTIKGDVTGVNLQGSHINAGGNTVILTEGTVVDGNVTAVDGANAGSMRFLGGDYSSVYSNNRVVMNNATVTGAVSGMSSDSGSLPVDMQTAGNTLVLAGHNEAGTIAGFETLDLTLSEQNKTQSVLTLTHGESTLSDATIVIRGADVLEQGKLIEAIDNARLSVTDATVELRGTFIKKVAQNVDFTVESGEDNALTTDSDVLASAKVQATESASSLSESLLGTAAFVRQGAEFVADDGLATMEFAARSKQGLNAFAVMQGSSMHYDALSGVDVSGFTLLAGAAVQQGNLTFASFVESGWGNSEGDIAKNSTDLSYFGVGLAARYRFESGFYGEGAVRLGRASSDFAASFVEDGDRARYESDVFYTTMHMAAGYELPLNDFVTADMYARYTFSFLDNDSVDLNDAAQSRAELDSVVSHALRIGARVKGGFTDAVNWKAGIAYEHMFDGAAGGTVDGVSITEAEMDGGSVIGELGVSVKPGSGTGPWTLQFALKGYLGEREGVSGNGMLVYSF